MAKVRARGWKNDYEREELLKSLAAAELEAEDIAWMVAESDPALRPAGLALLARHPWETASSAVFPLLGSRTEAVRQHAMRALESLAGGSFGERLPALLGHADPAVVHAALDHLKRHPSEKALSGIAKVLASSHSPAIRRKAFAIVEATSSPRVASIALQAVDDDDEDLRFRAVQLLAKHPDESQIAPLLQRCRGDSSRVQDAAIAALGPLMAGSKRPWTEEVLPLLCDTNPKVRQLASRLVATQEPVRVADAFLHTYKGTYGPTRDRAVEALRELGPGFIRAFLERDHGGDPGEQALAASIAVTIRAPESVEHCIRFLTGDDWWLRDRAAMALSEIRDEAALPHLLKMLQDPESNLSAAAALGAWGTPKALPALLEAYKQATPFADLRLEILDAFARIPDPKVPPLLQKIVQVDPDALVKEKAARLAASLVGGAAEAEAPAGTRVFEPVDFAATPRPTLPDLLRHARAVGASDLHLATATVPQIRIHGRLGPLPLPPSSPEHMEAWISPILSGRQPVELEERRQLDFCHKDPELGRFRTNVFYQRKGLNAVFRLVPPDVPSLTDIGLPESVWELTTYSQGLVLVTGPAGCGKTTTLAALVDRINQTQRVHVITIEDPIEYVHVGKEALVNQREVPSHSVSFAKALRQTLREDPDVILVGEMRDLETIALAITASETGHLVLGTLHTTNAAATVDRVINAFPPGEQGQIRMMIADSLKAVISQSLLPRRDGTGRAAAFEILRASQAISGLIREGKTFQIPSAMQTSAGAGMVLLDGALMQLVQEGIIEPRVAYDRAQRKEAFEPLLSEEGGLA